MERYDAERLVAVSAVESLRAGVPTRVSTRELTDLRPALTGCIRTDLLTFLDGRAPRGRLVWGQYGQGKTHVLTTVEHMALDMGFAVSMVSLNREVSCHNLLHFYGRVAPQVRTPDSTILGVERGLLQKTAEDLANSPLQDPERYCHPLPAQILEDFFYTTGEDQNLLYGDLAGIRLPISEFRRIHRQCRQSPLPKAPVPFKMSEHAAAYFGVMSDAIRLCGYKGWVILIDEVELTGRLGNLNRLKAYRKLHWLLNWSGTMQYPIYTLAAAATRLQDDIWYGGGKDDRNVMPDFAAAQLGEAAGRELEVFFERAIGNESLVAAPVDEDNLYGLLAALATLHGRAYNWPAQFDMCQLVRDMGAQPVRTYVRAAMESLDHQYVYNEKARLIASVLTEQTLDGVVEEESGDGAGTGDE
ncbi:MAG: BREX system ATP-binding domain-containing protein [Negativicutes bacterium]